MIKKILHSLLGSANDRYLKAIQPLVLKINSYEESLQALSDDALKGKTAEFKERLKNGESLDDLLAEAFAVVREASVRTLGMRHFDVQLLGGIVLHKGHISEMKTGEGKTLVATLAAYLNALEGKGVHLVTVNEYLARRDAEWMGKIYKFLGLSVGVIFSDLDPMERQQAYLAGVTYGTNNEFGFDYLRDNLKMSREQMAMRDFNFAIIDEVDSILIDEARTPLIISGPTETLSKNYVAVDKLIPLLSSDDFELDEKARSISLTDAGSDTIEKLLQDNTDLLQDGGLYDVQNISILHHIDQALRSHHLFKRDKDYVVKDNQIVIIDEFTGRLMKGRRYSDGLHQAIEAKENVPVQTENQTLASVTFQNYFRMYPKLSGMTGTAMTEAEEFEEIYSLPVIAIPTNKEMQRIDNDDEVYRTSRERDQAFLQDLKICYARKQPVLVGTISIDRSEELSKFLKKEKIPHKVLNANQDASEAEIIAEAGAPGAITIATNMAGRGTDIQLGGNLDSRLEKALKGAGDAQKKEKIIAEVTTQYEKDKADVLAAGGVYVLGTERHESRRIDNQLRGRSGRQGDPGATKFYVSLEDDLMRIFGSERIEKILTTLGLEEGEAIIHPWISKALEKAQQKVEGRNFEIRKQLLKYDDVMNDQRKVIFSQRIELMDSDNVNETVIEMREEVIEELIERTIPDGTMPDQWQLDTLHTDSMRLFAMDLPVKRWAEEEGVGQEEIKARLYDAVNEHMQKKREQYGDDLMNRAEKSLVLQILDHHWKEHLLQLDHLRASVGLRAYAQRDPLNEYKQESFSLFEGLLWKMNETVTQVLSHLQISTDAFTKPAREKQKQSENLREGRVLQSAPFDENDPTTWGKTARNSPCPCKSGKKYKHCHGKL